MYMYTHVTSLEPYIPSPLLPSSLPPSFMCLSLTPTYLETDCVGLSQFIPGIWYGLARVEEGGREGRVQLVVHHPYIHRHQEKEVKGTEFGQRGLGRESGGVKMHMIYT